MEGGERNDSADKRHCTIIAKTGDIDQQVSTSEFQEHSAEVTPMLISQMDAGYIKCKEHYEIANMESLRRAARPNDLAFFEGVKRFVKNVDATWSFSNEAIDTYLGANGEPMPGLRWSEAEQKLVRVKDATVDEKRLYLAQILIPAVKRKFMAIDPSKFTPEQLEEIKLSAIGSA